MPDTFGSAADDGEDRRARRQERLEKLRLGRPRALGRAGGLGLVGGQAGGARAAEGGAQVQRRRALGRVVRILTETPADESGLVAGTTFTRSGVAALVTELSRRSSTPGAAGEKVAARVLGFLRDGDTGEAVHGVSLQKLQRLSKLVERIRGRGRIGRHGRG